MPNPRLLIAIAVGFVFAAMSACASTQREQSVSICDIVSNPAAHDGRVVRVTGIFASDYHHGSLLLDGRCAGRGIAPLSPAQRTAGQSAFERTLCSTDGLVEVTATGRLEVRPDQVPWLVLYVTDYSAPRPVAFDPAWGSRLLETEAQTTPGGARSLFCRMAQIADEQMGQ